MISDDVLIRCPACREKQWIEIDFSEGDQQDLIQDCEICCRPLRILMTRDASGRARAEASLTDGF